VAVAETANLRVGRVQARRALVGVALGHNAPAPVVALRQRFEPGDDCGTIVVAVGDQREIDWLEAVREQALEREPRVRQRAGAQHAIKLAGGRGRGMGRHRRPRAGTVSFAGSRHTIDGAILRSSRSGIRTRW